jgi:hypothetical protein
MTPPVELTRVDLARDAEVLFRAADWIDQTVGHGSDQAAQIRSVAATVQALALSYTELDRLEQAP